MFELVSVRVYLVLQKFHDVIQPRLAIQAAPKRTTFDDVELGPDRNGGAGDAKAEEAEGLMSHNNGPASNAHVQGDSRF